MPKREEVRLINELTGQSVTLRRRQLPLRKKKRQKPKQSPFNRYV